MDSITGRYFDPCAEAYLEPLGLEHFFDAFGLEYKSDLRVAAADALGHLTPICVPEAPSAKRAKRTKESDYVTNDVEAGSADVNAEPDSSKESDSSSSGSNSDFSSEDGSSDESDLDKFEEAFAEFGKLSEGLDDIECEG